MLVRALAAAALALLISGDVARLGVSYQSIQQGTVSVAEEFPSLTKPVTVAELDPTSRRIGAARNQWARQVYQHCTATDRWPPYVEGIHEISLPRWAEIEQGEGII